MLHVFVLGIVAGEDNVDSEEIPPPPVEKSWDSIETKNLVYFDLETTSLGTCCTCFIMNSLYSQSFTL